jgi:hypothetical protein
VKSGLAFVALLVLTVVFTMSCASRQVSGSMERTVEFYIPGCG